MDPKGHQIICGQVFRDQLVHLPYKIWADTVNTERHQFVDVKLSPELRVDSFHELRVGAVNAHGNQLIGRNVFADMLANLADEFGRNSVNAERHILIDVKVLA